MKIANTTKPKPTLAPLDLTFELTTVDSLYLLYHLYNQETGGEMYEMYFNFIKNEREDFSQICKLIEEITDDSSHYSRSQFVQVLKTKGII